MLDTATGHFNAPNEKAVPCGTALIHALAGLLVYGILKSLTSLEYRSL